MSNNVHSLFDGTNGIFDAASSANYLSASFTSSDLLAAEKHCNLSDDVDISARSSNSSSSMSSDVFLSHVDNENFDAASSASCLSSSFLPSSQDPSALEKHFNSSDIDNMTSSFTSSSSVDSGVVFSHPTKSFMLKTA